LLIEAEIVVLQLLLTFARKEKEAEKRFANSAHNPSGNCRLCHRKWVFLWNCFVQLLVDSQLKDGLFLLSLHNKKNQRRNERIY